MDTLEPKTFILGESSFPTEGIVVPQERKSPGIDDVTPTHDHYYTVDPARHLDPAHVDVEWGKLWTRTWLCAGRLSEINDVGSWFKFDIGRESLIVCRSSEDDISAFYNVCQHRGNQLVSDDFGKAGRFVCRYHSWNYSRTGECVRVTDRDLFKDDALCGDLNIPQVRCETYGGFVFVNMDDDAPSLLEYLGEIPDILSGYLFDEMVVLNDVLLDMDCNWKTMLEAFSENYHVHIAHPEASWLTDERFTQIDFYAGGHSRRLIPVGVHNSRRGKAGAINDIQRVILQNLGVDVERFDGNADDVRRAIQVAKRSNPGALEDVFDRLSDGQLSDDWAMNIFPNLHLSCHAEGVLTLRYYPHPTDPGRCQLHASVLGFKDQPFDDGFYPSPVVSDDKVLRIHVRHDDPDVIEAVGIVLGQDIPIAIGTQRGMGSKGFSAIRLSEHEQVIRHQYAEIDRYLDLV